MAGVRIGQDAGRRVVAHVKKSDEESRLAEVIVQQIVQGGKNVPGAGRTT